MKESTAQINWKGYADGSAIREAIIGSINQEILGLSGTASGMAARSAESKTEKKNRTHLNNR